MNTELFVEPHGNHQKNEADTVIHDDHIGEIERQVLKDGQVRRMTCIRFQDKFIHNEGGRMGNLSWILKLKAMMDGC